MAYTKQTWVDGNSAYPASAARFGVLEQGVFNAAAVADQGHMILTTAQRDSLGVEPTGTMIFNSSVNALQVYNGTKWVAASTMSIPPSARARLTGAKALTSGNAIPWDAVSSPGWDTDSMWNVGSATRITVTTPGLYLVTCNILTQVTVAQSTSQTLTVRYNGASGTYAEFTNPVTVALNGFPTMNVSALISATTSGDYFDAVYAFVGGTHTALNDNRNSFSAALIGRIS